MKLLLYDGTRFNNCYRHASVGASFCVGSWSVLIDASAHISVWPGVVGIGGRLFLGEAPQP